MISYLLIYSIAGPNACRIRLRLPSSVATICVDKTATIHELVLYIQHNYPELNNIDLLTGNPPVSILDDVFFLDCFDMICRNGYRWMKRN